VARVELRRISKSYPGLKVLDDVSLSIRSGEFFTLLGPSGCGKTTLLRTVAGFNKQDAGQVLVDGTGIDNVPAHRRNIGMVYQDYAIFPHLTVADNVAFGLQMRHVSRREIGERTDRALALVQLGGLAARLPHEVVNPRILLMDEPLSNLDAKLRVELRDDIRDLQRSLGITTIYVTHDQEEALVISDRVCIMQTGRVHQIGAPQDIYARPATLFVASFVGAMNVLPDVAVGPGGEVALGAGAPRLPSLAGRARVTLAIRPEDVVLGDPPAADPGIVLDGVVTKASFAGREAYYRIEVSGDLHLLAHVYRPHERPLAALGERVALTLPVARLHAFDPGDERRIETGP
jgi:ABC-type Fe3+/spermidine/putrescine transport system ATPase subunit